MKIRSPEELVDYLSTSSAFRKHELISAKGMLENPKTENKNLISRLAVVLAYAHWEGFIKEAATAYLTYIASKKRPLSKLMSNIQAVCCRKQLTFAQNSSLKIQKHIDLVSLLTKDIHRSVTIDIDGAIDTESNLTSAVFKNICMTIGISDDALSSRYPFIDEIVANRCSIAHGCQYTPLVKYAVEAVAFTIFAINFFKNEIENAAINKLFLCPTPENA